MLRSGIFSLCLLTFGLSLTFELVDSKHPTPEEKVELYKREVQFKNEFFFNRLWTTEALTCVKVGLLLEDMKRNMKTDLMLILKDARRLLDSVGHERNKKTRRCIEDIKEQIDDAATLGVENFSKCTATSSIKQNLIKSEMLENRKKHSTNTSETFSKLDRCLIFTSIKSNTDREQCLDKLYDEYNNQSEYSRQNLRQSKCMDHFTNEILSCAFKVFSEIQENRKQLFDDISTCVGYSPSQPAQNHSSFISDKVLSNYTTFYMNFNIDYESVIEGFFDNILHSFRNVHNNLDNDRVAKELIPYYKGLTKATNENWSPKDRDCNIIAVKSLNNLSANALKDMNSCREYFTQQEVQASKTLRSVLDHFNGQLVIGGNVALLDCIDRRPGEVFQSVSLETCADLARRKILWEREKVNIQLDSIKETMVQKEVLPGGGTCNELRLKQLLLDAEQVMDNCARCLYGEYGGTHYAVTPEPVD